MKSYSSTILLLALISILSTPRRMFGQKLAEGPQVLSFFSEADDTEQPYGIYITKKYDPSRKYPLLMMLHGAGSNHRLALRRVFGKSNLENETDVEATRYFPKWDDVDFIVATPSARGTAGYQGIPEQDVYDVLADVKKRFNIDENRTYLTGLSMGGGGALWLGLTRPDIWAAIAAVCPAPPAGTSELVSNALNMPVHFFHGDADPVVPVEGTRKWVAEMQDIGIEVTYKEFVDVKHDSWVSAYDAGYIFEWLKEIERVAFPNHVKFNSRLHKYNKAYWVTLDKLVSGQLAEIDAKIGKGNTIRVSTKNLKAFTLNLNGHPLFNPSEELNVSLDGIVLPVRSNGEIHFEKRLSKWSQKKVIDDVSGLSKSKGAEGPLLDVFSTRHLYVYGTLDNPAPDELKRRVGLATEAANWSVYRGEFLGRVMFFPRVVADKDIRPSDIESSNLILFGTKETNAIIGKLAPQLPLAFDNTVKNYGLFYVFPAGKRYVAVSSGLPWWTGAKDNGFPFVPVPFRKLSEFKDVFLFKDSIDNVILNEYFTDDWKLPESARTMLRASGTVIIN